MLGHSNVAITLDTYSHVTPTMPRKAARVMDSLLPLTALRRRSLSRWVEIFA